MKRHFIDFKFFIGVIFIFLLGYEVDHFEGVCRIAEKNNGRRYER